MMKKCKILKSKKMSFYTLWLDKYPRKDEKNERWQLRITIYLLRLALHGIQKFLSIIFLKIAQEELDRHKDQIILLKALWCMEISTFTDNVIEYWNYLSRFNEE